MKTRINALVCLVLGILLGILGSAIFHTEKKSIFSSEKLDIAGKKWSGYIDSPLINKFIQAYRQDSLPIYSDIQDQTTNMMKIEKGFFLDSNVIDTIMKYEQKNVNGTYLYDHHIDGIFLYLAKKTPEYGDKYTLIAIPSTSAAASTPNNYVDSLMIKQSLEWHDPISHHIPVNEHAIGY